MNDRDQQRLHELERRTAYLLARQDEQLANLHRLMARLAYVEACQHRLMKQLGIEPGELATYQTALDDARTLNQLLRSEPRLN